MKAKKINGKDLLIFIGGKAVALTTDTSLSLRADTVDAATKDDGLYDNQEIGKLGWSATNDSYYAVDSDADAGKVGEELIDAMLAAEPVEVIWGSPANATKEDLPDGGWTVPTDNAYKGTAIITQLDIKATNGQKATCSLSLQGQGPLTKIGTAAASAAPGKTIPANQ